MPRPISLKRLALLALFSVSLLLSTTAHAENIARPVGITVTCDCADPTGRAYGAAVQTLLSHEPRFKQMDLEEGSRNNAIQVHIFSTPLQSTDGTPRVALSIVYLHDGVIMHHFIQTCTHMPIEDCASTFVRDLKQMESTQAAMLH